jgi:putative transposase
MKKRFSEEQIVRVLKEALDGKKISEVCRRYGISEATFYNWRKRFEGMQVSELRKLRNLEDENSRLKRLLADKELDIDCLKALLQKHDEAR